MGNTNASVTLFGWDFQINAAIVLMLENIEIAEQVRVEGKTEDIEIKLNNGKCIYSQAKSVEKSADYSHVKEKLKKAMVTLSNASQEADCDKLIYVTNSPNPLGKKDTMSIFYGHSRRLYCDLSPSCQSVVDGILEKITCDHLDTAKFSVHVIPFETNDLKERYKVIKSVVDDFVSSIKPGLTGVGQSVMDIWQKNLFENATITNTQKVIKKKDLIWPLIVLMSDIKRYDNPILKSVDESDWDEITNKYKDLINNKVERFDFATRVLSDYKDFIVEDFGKKTFMFLNSKWKEYKNEFDIDGVDDMIQEKLIKIIIYNIIRQKYLISDVKKKVHI